MIHLPLVLLFSVSSPEPPAADTRCDLRCTAQASVREANHANDKFQRAAALTTAARAYLALFRGSDAAGDLCAANRYIERVFRLKPAYWAPLGDRPQATRSSVVQEMTRLGIECSKPDMPRPSAVASSRPALPSDASSAGADKEVASASQPDKNAVEAPPPGPGDELLPVVAAVGEQRPQVLERAPAPSGSFPVSNTKSRHPPAARTRSGRAELIVGGILLGGASLAGGIAALAGARIDRVTAQQNAVAAESHVQGFSSPEMVSESHRLEATGAHWRQVLIITSITSAALGVTAVALVISGATKYRRSGRVAVAPMLPGLLFTARF